MHISMHESGARETIDRLLPMTGKLGQRAVTSALKSVGYNLQQDIQDYGRRGSRVLWGRNNPHTPIIRAAKGSAKRQPKQIQTKRYKTGQRKGQVLPKRSRSTNPMSRLVNAPRYNVISEFANGGLDEQIVEIGFVGSASNLRGLVSSMAVPAAWRVTPKMRRFFWAIGFPIKESTQWLYRRKRPWVQPVFRQQEHKTDELFERKFISALERYGVNFD